MTHAAENEATTTAGAALTAVPGVAGDTDLALVNGRIHTMDANDAVVSHVLIRNGRFIAVGNGPVRAQGRPFAVVNLRGRTVVPGIVDNHNHIVLMGNRPGHHTPLENAQSIAEVQETYARRADQIPSGAWITTIGGFHRNHLVAPDLPPRLPTLTELDAAAPDHPIYLSESFSGPSATNSAGRAFFTARGIPVGDDGFIAAGNPTGRATLALRQTLLTADERKRGAVDALAHGLSLGVTTHLDQGAFQATGTPSDGAAHEDNFTMHLPFLELLEEGRLDARLRINFLHMESDQTTPELAARLRNAFPFFGGDLVRTGGIGEFIAQGTGPASPFLAAARKVAAAGWRAEVHSLSQTDFQQEIQAFETVHAQTPISDLRWVDAHVPFITEEYAKRLDALGGGLSLTGWRYLAGSPAQNGPPFRMIVDSGIHAGMSSDGMQIAPMNPWLHMYYATTGRNARGVVINAGQQITRQEALRLYTRDNGWFLREEDELGSIEAGKHADLAVLDRDYFTVPDDDLKRLRSLFTVVGGRVVHDPRRWVR
ncbi:amidohydrolase [Jiangella asiatica]|uniref:amidohydrolase n=1 Tax=Jiangella asiatica TaxID=2530372 RepID=UPI0013A5F038|nr:amidohydrolase family protein [Jiangella asiatica]